jgi:hypothetical protein
MTKTTVPRGWSNSKGMRNNSKAATALEDGVRDPGRRIVYNGPVLFDLMIMFLVVRSFIDKLNGSNFIELQLSVVKR